MAGAQVSQGQRKAVYWLFLVVYNAVCLLVTALYLAPRSSGSQRTLLLLMAVGKTSQAASRNQDGNTLYG